MDSLQEIIQNTTKDEWLSSLPDYQQQSLIPLLLKLPEEEVAKSWVDSSFKTTSPFSADNSKKGYFDYVKVEFTNFICGNPKYDEQRNEIKSQIDIQDGIKTFIVSSISTAIGSQIGASAVIIAPVIVILLSLAGKIGVNAYCEMSHYQSED